MDRADWTAGARAASRAPVVALSVRPSSPVRSSVESAAGAPSPLPDSTAVGSSASTSDRADPVVGTVPVVIGSEVGGVTGWTGGASTSGASTGLVSVTARSLVCSSAAGAWMVGDEMEGDAVVDGWTGAGVAGSMVGGGGSTSATGAVTGVTGSGIGVNTGVSAMVFRRIIRSGPRRDSLGRRVRGSGRPRRRRRARDFAAPPRP